MHMAPEDCFATFVLCYFAFSFVVLEHVCKKKKVECLQMFENYRFRKHQCVWSWQNRFKLRYFWETHSKTNLKPDSAGFSCVFQKGWLLQDTGSNSISKSTKDFSYKQISSRMDVQAGTHSDNAQFHKTSN